MCIAPAKSISDDFDCRKKVLRYCRIGIRLKFRELKSIPFWCRTYFIFLMFSASFWIPIIFSNLNSYCSNIFDLRNLQEQVKKAFCYQKLFWTFTVWTNCSSDLKIFANSRPSASNFKSFSRSLEQFFLTVI